MSQILDFKSLETDSVHSLNTFIEKVDSPVNALQKLNLKLPDFALIWDTFKMELIILMQNCRVLSNRPWYELVYFSRYKKYQTASSNKNFKKAFSKMHCSSKSSTNKTENFTCQMRKDSEHKLYQYAKFLNLPAIESEVCKWREIMF